ncbi:VapE domain-containing protein [Methylomonas koyamae]|uniref:VapE domain-containing protein n=1 Tax=Methylomonas koyamae TaxID=702114 RepID=UPI001126BE52|nr:VapE domain-containing protein [Methylomonas koyamae]TPQ24923.1 hypothetical protein C2U68_17245 [Methylomonas koyamae]
MAKKIDFARINQAALASFRSLVAEWIPGGEFSGAEYRVLNPTRSDNSKGSFSVNITKGVWSDFATGDTGSDPISLFAYLFHSNNQGAAAKELAAIVGVDVPNNPPKGSHPKRKPASVQSTPTVATAEKPGKESAWTSIRPPANVPERHQAHPVRGLPEQVWTYRDVNGELLGYVFRFRTSDGGKEVLPLTWCRHTGGREDWRWMQWAVPRPLYGLDRLTVADVDDPKHQAPVLIVEGEKCADAGAAELTDWAVLAWSGGGKAVDKADWQPLSGRRVFIWPDCDAQVDKQGQLKPEAEQPGMMAARKVAAKLTGMGCKVWLVQIPAPGEKPSGWDIADAIAEGITGEALESFIRSRLLPFEPAPATEAAAEPAAKPLSTPETAGAGGGKSRNDSGKRKERPQRDGWQANFHVNDRGKITPCRANVALILENYAEWQGVLGYNEFSHQVMKLKRPPWGGSIGPWENHDDAALDEWLTRGPFGLVIRSLGTLAEVVDHVARKHPYHPVREHLEGLPAWDGKTRTLDFLAAFTDNENSDYLRVAGRLFLLGMVKRIYEPGCKFDYMLVLEGQQGLGKSTFFKILGGDWFSETPFDVNTNEGNMRIQGVWLQEMAEMDSFRKAEDTAFKSFLAITRDKFRRPYDRRPIEAPRVCVFGGTTNLRQYLKDITGNRRIWPVWCNAIDNEGLRKDRDQLFAEALHLYRTGERCYPTHEEERELFEPEQRMRLIVEGWEELIKVYLSSPEADIRNCNFFTTIDLLTKGVGLERSKVDERAVARMGRIMAKIGWKRLREPSGIRRWGYVRPEHQRDSQSIFPPSMFAPPEWDDD